MSVRVLIVEPPGVVRVGLASLVNAEGDLEAVGEADSAGEAIFEARTTKPDVVVVDVTTEQSGIEAVSKLLQDWPEAKVLVLSRADDPRYVREAFEAGASGYVLEDRVDHELASAIREVSGGGRYVRPELGARNLAVLRPKSSQSRAEESAAGLREKAAPVNPAARIDGVRRHGGHRT